jgi:hypothetical protein
MSRELKFRVWDTLDKRFIYPDKGYQGHYILTLGGEFYNLQNGSGGNEYVVQQYTGIKDVNGVDIYEGDVVTKGFELLNFLCEYSIEDAAYILSYEHGFNYLTDFSTLKVVGNIYENPKLVENEYEY